MTALTLGGNERAHGILLGGRFVAILDYCGDAPLELVDFAPVDVQAKYERLFIEAPEMLKCLERAVAIVEDYLDTADRDANMSSERYFLKKARESIKRARGTK